MNDVELDQLLNVWEAPMPSPALRRTTLAAFPRDWRWKIGGLPVRWLAAAALGAGTLAVGTSLWSDPELGYQFQGSVDGDSSLYMRLSRRIDPPSAKIRWLLKGGGSSIRDTPAGGIAGMSYLRDRSAGRFYGFKYDVEPTGNGYYQVTFAPFDEAALGRRGPFKMPGEIVQAAPPGAPQYIRDGESFDATFYLVDGVRIYDRVQISTHPFPKQTPPQTPEQQQWDALRLHLENPKLYLNGALAGSDTGGGGSGPCLWVHLPGEGRHLVTLNPMGNTNFVPAGHVNGTVLEFTAEGRQFRIESGAAIATGGDRPVYVYHQQSFEHELDPAHPNAQRVMFGNAGPPQLQR